MGRVCDTLMWLLSLLIASVGASPHHHYDRSYDTHRVYRSVPESEAAREALDREIRLAEGDCEFMKEAHKPGLPSDFMCEDSVAQPVLDRVARAGLTVDTVIENLGTLIRESREEHTRIKRQAEGMHWDNYQRYDTIIPWMEKLAADNPSFITLTNMGSSHEERKILMLKVGNSPRGSETRAVWIDGGIHAREWIAVATATYLLDKIVTVFRDNDTSTCEARAVQAVDWYIAPLLNPDGYEYSHTNDRMWRKNRSPPPPGSSCYGVDLNRNWDVIGFGAGVTSSNPCAETYKGTAPNSEPETQVIAETIQKYKSSIRIYLTFHSYGQYWLTSFGYKTQLPVDNEKLVTLGRQAVDAIQCVTPSRSYTIGSAGAIFYIAGGASDDYAKAAAEIPYSFTVELPDSGRYGFLLPAGQIQTVGQELWAATGVIAKEAARHPTGADPARERERRADSKLGL